MVPWLNKIITQIRDTFTDTSKISKHAGVTTTRPPAYRKKTYEKETTRPRSSSRNSTNKPRSASGSPRSNPRVRPEHAKKMTAATPVKRSSTSRSATGASKDPKTRQPRTRSAPTTRTPRVRKEATAARSKSRGVVTQYFEPISVAILRLEYGRVRLGDQLRIHGDSTDFTQRITSLQVDHKGVDVVHSGQEFGIKVIASAKPGDKVEVL